MRKLILAVVAAMGFVSAAQAKTLQYSFDVTGSDIYFASATSSPTPDPNVVRDPDVLQALHVLGGLAGQTGQVQLQLTFPYPNAPLAPSNAAQVTCLSGFLCNNGAFVAQSQNLVYATGASDFHMVGGKEWSAVFDAFGGGVLSFFDDGDISVSGLVNGDYYDMFGPSADFTLSNVSVQVIANPLPPAAALYGAILLPVVWWRRKRATT
jgi:hypothetical protein